MSLKVDKTCPRGANIIRTTEAPKQNLGLYQNGLDKGEICTLKVATERDLSYRYEENHSKAVPDTPIKHLSLLSRI